MAETEFLQTAQQAARAAGRVLANWAGRFTVSEKSPANLVTEADVAAQQAIYDLIHARFPDHNFLGEEGLARRDGPSSYGWVIDPLDGTSNYVHAFPYYAVSIAVQRDNELLAGVVFDPNRDEMFSAVRGRGARLNDLPIQPTRVDSLKSAMVVASLPVGVGRDDPAVQRFLNVLPRAQTLQRTGSAALNLAYVAAGRMDAFWSSSLHPWDMAAGVLLVSEAGGRVTKMDGGEFELSVSDVLCSNGSPLHEELQQLLTGGKDDGPP